MNFNPAWKVASVIVAVCLAWSHIEPTALAQAPAPAEKAAKQEEVASSSENRVAMAAPSPAPAPAPAKAPAKAQQGASKPKSKWWVLLGVAAAGILTAVVVSRHQAEQPTITGLPPCVGAGC